MSNSFFKSFYFSIILFVIIVLFICCFFIPVFAGNNITYSSAKSGYQFVISDAEYVWPAPGYTSINSYFGKRNAPTAGASSYHKGVDIGAPQGATLIAITSGKITFTGFLGRRWIYHNSFF